MCVEWYIRYNNSQITSGLVLRIFIDYALQDRYQIRAVSNVLPKLSRLDEELHQVFSTLVCLLDFVFNAFLMYVAFVLAILKLILDLSMGLLSIIIKSMGLLRREHFLFSLRCLTI